MTEPDTQPSDPNDHAGVIAHPPIIYAGFLLAGWGIGKLWPLGLGLGDAGIWLGAGLVVVAFAIIGVCANWFRKQGTTLPTNLPTTAIVTEGLYRYSRNPIYIGLSLAYLGLLLILDAGWALVLLPVVLVLMNEGVVKREEAYLAGKFGQPYLDYKAKVRRWL
ncbi:MAG: isoprenylcysteine carboxylmethyltransferase family protein [Sphingomonadales bacterium]|nr:isoprenylcysteine carboxylmethyltransferase family protein [Sphingomonadales bacterium]